MLLFVKSILYDENHLYIKYRKHVRTKTNISKKPYTHTNDENS